MNYTITPISIITTNNHKGIGVTRGQGEEEEEKGGRGKGENDGQKSRLFFKKNSALFTHWTKLIIITQLFREF